MNHQDCVNIVGPYVRKLREERGWSLEELADNFARQGIAVSRQTLARIESQQEPVTEIDVLAFALLFRTDVAQLLPSYPTSPEALEEFRMVNRNSRAVEDRCGFVLESFSISDRAN